MTFREGVIIYKRKIYFFDNEHINAYKLYLKDYNIWSYYTCIGGLIKLFEVGDNEIYIRGGKKERVFPIKNNTHFTHYSLEEFLNVLEYNLPYIAMGTMETSFNNFNFKVHGRVY